MNSLATTCIQTTCPYCGVGCGVDGIGMAGDLNKIQGSVAHPANFGRLCVKGSALRETLTPHNRLLVPKIQGQPVSWDTAISAVADGFRKTVAEYGPDSVAFYLSGQLLTEDYYVANKLMKGFIGSANVDTNSRLCMASAVVGYKRAFGADAVPCNYEDLELCDLLILIGSNAAWTHPVLFQRITAAKAARPQMKIVVVDPRRTASCEIADLHLQIRPGSDAFLFNGLLHYLQQSGAMNQTFLDLHCNDALATLAAASTCTIDAVASLTSVDPNDLQQFYVWFARTEKTVSFYSQGVNQSTSGSDKCNTIINCHLVTGRIGRPGMGPFSITGQPNAMGGREVGGLATQLAAHMDFSDENCARVARFWGAKRIAQRPGLKAVDLFDAMLAGKIKAVWIMATNPVVSLPDSEKIRRALRQCELVVVSDCTEHTDTNAFATILLPASGWGEKDGTVTNSERCISRQRALLPAMGEARPDWRIVCDVARELGFADAFDFRTPRDIFVEHAALSGFENNHTRAFDISALTGLTETGYASLQPVQWPVNADHPEGSARLFADRRFYTSNGRANLVPIQALLPLQQTCAQFPFRLNTGRMRDQWHTMTRTGNVTKLLTHSDSPSAWLHPADIAALATSEGELLEVSSKLGRLLLTVRTDSGVKPGEVFIPIHWNQQFSKNATVCALIDSRVDPVSGQPESKLEAVRLDPVTVLAWFAVISTRELPLESFDYWHKVPIKGGYRYLLACTDNGARQDSLHTWIERITPRQSCMEFHNEVSGENRFLYFENAQLVMAVLQSPSARQLPEPAWLNGLLGTELEADNWLLLAGRPLHRRSTGNLICSCFEVGETAIREAIALGATNHLELGSRLACGTNCGSCIPELKRLLRECGTQPQHTAPTLTIAPVAAAAGQQ